MDKYILGFSAPEYPRIIIFWAVLDAEIGNLKLKLMKLLVLFDKLPTTFQWLYWRRMIIGELVAVYKGVMS